jgi:RNA polymerase sigma-70 factor, ECF subfamily
VAAGRLFRGAFISLNMATRDCTLQGAVGAAPSNRVELDEASTVPDSADDPEVVLQKKDRAEALHQSLHRLSPEHREVIDLSYYHGKSVKEIAEIVGIHEATVKTRMFYARKKLAELVTSA